MTEVGDEGSFRRFCAGISWGFPWKNMHGRVEDFWRESIQNISCSLLREHIDKLCVNDTGISR